MIISETIMCLLFICSIYDAHSALLIHRDIFTGVDANKSSRKVAESEAFLLQIYYRYAYISQIL